MARSSAPRGKSPHAKTKPRNAERGARQMTPQTVTPDVIVVHPTRSNKTVRPKKSRTRLSIDMGSEFCTLCGNTGRRIIRRRGKDVVVECKH